MRLEVPDHLQRGAPRVRAAGPENTGQKLLALIAERVGLRDFADVDILDVGCGVRFAQTIVNRAIPVKSYAGVEVEPRIVEFLNEHLARVDRRFRFYHWNVRNAMYNPAGVPLADAAPSLPPLERFDLIVLWSVFTHLAPDDAAVMLELLRSRVRPGGKLFFTAFIDDALATFEDRDKEHALRAMYYGRDYLHALIARAGWSIDAAFPGDFTRFVQPHVVCSPR